MRGDTWKIPLFGLLSLQCNHDKDPGQTAASTGTDGSGDSDDSTPTSSDTGAGAGPHAPCERFLECLAAVEPESVMAATKTFGDDGGCWADSPDNGEGCRELCGTYLESYHEKFPEQQLCLPCLDDGDCEAGSSCFGNKCLAPAVCGDGKLDPGEVCDGDSCDPDCAGPQACQPVNNAGCGPNEVCKVSNQMAVCVPLPADPAGPMEPCGGDEYDTGDSYGEPSGGDYYETYGETGGGGDTGDTGGIPFVDDCAAGLQCILGPIECQGESCCMPFCVIGEIPCESGAQCIWFQYPSPLDELGVCGTL